MAYSRFRGIIDTLTMGVGFNAGQSPDMIHISGNIYAVVYQDGVGIPPGRVETFSIDANGIFSAVIDTLVFDAVRAESPTISHVSGDTYAIVYTGPDLDGWLVTISIDTNGNIGGAILDSLEFDAVQGTMADILHLSGDFFVIIYAGPDTDGWLATVEIDAAGNITAPITDSWEFDAGWGRRPHIIHIAGTIYAFTYEKFGGAGQLTTIAIADNGVIGAVVDTYQFSADSAPTRMLHIAGDVYAIAWIGGGGAQVLTIEIDIAGNITVPPIDTRTMDDLAEDSWEVDFIHFGDDIYIIAYVGDRNLNDRGWVASMSISLAGALALIDRFEYETPFNVEMLSMLPVSSAIITVASYVPSDCVVKTISLLVDPSVQTLPATGITK